MQVSAAAASSSSSASAASSVAPNTATATATPNSGVALPGLYAVHQFQATENHPPFATDIIVIDGPSGLPRVVVEWSINDSQHAVLKYREAAAYAANLLQLDLRNWRAAGFAAIPVLAIIRTRRLRKNIRCRMQIIV